MKTTTMIILALACAMTVEAKVQLPQMFQNGMVLQRGKPIPIWGQAEPGEHVSVELLNTAKAKKPKRVCLLETTAGNDGRWQVALPPQKAGGPFALEVKSGEVQTSNLKSQTSNLKSQTSKIIDDILIGDVWLCSGQSNIDVTVERVYPQYGQLIDDYQNPQIRMFRVQTDADTHGPKRDIKPTPINWKPVTKENVWPFSAVGYFLGREMYEKTGVPQGVIVNSVGGTPIQAWLDADTLKRHFPQEYQRTAFYQDDDMVLAMQRANMLTQSRWQRLMDEADPGLVRQWTARDFDDSQWPMVQAFGTHGNGRPKSINLTGDFRYSGSLWARQYVNVDAAHAGQPCRLLVGTLYDADQTYVNGQQVGATAYQYPPRRYTIPAGLLVEGRNALTVRFVTKGGAPHFIPEKPYKLIFDDGTEVALSNQWRVSEGARMQQCPGMDAGGQNLPTVLYNAMLHPLAPYALQGVVWYQGESNCGGDAHNYETWLTELVTGWRQLWQSPDLPFVIVQLANFMEPTDQPQESGWSVVREAQRQVALRQPNTELACIIDLGETVDIHPLRKREVAQRIAHNFEHILWNKKSHLAPVVTSATVNHQPSPATVLLSLDLPLQSDGPLHEFEVAGPDGRFVNAEATGQGNTITLRSGVTDPRRVRYAWKNNPIRADVFGRNGLPMSPFQMELGATQASNLKPQTSNLKSQTSNLKSHVPIVHDGLAATILIDPSDLPAVIRAAHDLSDDVRKVSGIASPVALTTTIDPQPSNQKGQRSKVKDQSKIVVGTIGHSRLIDQLVGQGKLNVTEVRGQWESFVIDIVDGSLVIAGSDRRGTIYGIYELSQRMGVSPWYWWADVPVSHSEEVYYDGGRFVMPSPKVKYRGIFINDEDWGLKPWAATNYEKELGDIGPKTYARVCELLLRLKANMLAPAMHSCTGAFYSHAESKAVCDSFGIVITTSHCEPLLLNNAAESEWSQQRDGDWNYKTNRETILKKWDNRLSEAAQYENIYTVAMRGVHDAGLRGNLPLDERVTLLEQVISDQRQLLASHNAYTPLHKVQSPKSKVQSPKPKVQSPKTEDIPQIFVPYKETMDIYEAGLRVPDDITLVWVDDNYGYMKRVSTPTEQRRSGRAGVYYHLSYLGAPHDYLWLNTTPPVLMYEELKKAYDAGADRYWLLNVGDIKPMELGIQTFMDMAWDIDAFDLESVDRHQKEWLAKTFGRDAKTFDFIDDFYRLAWSRKPEYMGFEYEWDDKAHEGLKATEFSFQNYGDAQQRLSDYRRLSDAVEQIATHLNTQTSGISTRSTAADCWFEILQFPVQASYQMNRKFLMAQLNQELLAAGRTAEANWAAHQTEQAYDSINALNSRYNSLLDGKWQGMMAVPPGFCALYQEKPAVTYTNGAGEQPVDLLQLTVNHTPAGCQTLCLADFTAKNGDVTLIKGLGYDGLVVQLGTHNTNDTDGPHHGQTSSSNSQTSGTYVDYLLPTIDRDSLDVIVYTVPFWPLHAGKGTAVGVSVDGCQPQVFDNKFKEYDRNWKDQVMRNGAVCRLRFPVDRHQPSHRLRLTGIDPGQMVQRIVIDWGGLLPSYVGPAASRCT